MAQLPPYVKTVSRVAAGFGVFQSVIWLLFSTLALISYLDCSFSRDDADIAPSGQFTHTLQSYFYLNDYCPNYKSLNNNIVSSYELHIWSAVFICASGIWFISSCSIFFYVTNANILYVNVSLYLWSIITLAVSSCDLAMGILFGMTFSTIGDMMNEADIDASTLRELVGVRAATLFLMMFALRGFVLMILNITFVIVLLYFSSLVNQIINQNEHNIHTMGPLYAYESNKPQREPWSMVSDYDERPHGGQVNRSYSRTEYENLSQIPHVKKPQEQAPAKDDSYSRSFDRSHSWHQAKGVTQGQRPFSYLEEPQFFKQPAPPNAPSPNQNSSNVPPWKRRDNPSIDPGLPIPSPDYSPPQNRRLKSALKPTAY